MSPAEVTVSYKDQLWSNSKRGGARTIFLMELPQMMHKRVLPGNVNVCPVEARESSKWWTRKPGQGVPIEGVADVVQGIRNQRSSQRQQRSVCIHSNGSGRQPCTIRCRENAMSRAPFPLFDPGGGKFRRCLLNGLADWQIPDRIARIWPSP